MYSVKGIKCLRDNYTETGAAVVSEYAVNNLNQYTSRTVPGVAAVRGEADPNATVTVNENPTFRLGSYYFGSDNFDNSSSVVSALGTDGLYKYYFTGHGGREAYLIIDADYKFWEEPEQVVIPGRYTNYGISEMVLQACYSSETPWVTGWLGNVARAGKFTGYAGAVNSSNMQELTKSFGGSGR